MYSPYAFHIVSSCFACRPILKISALTIVLLGLGCLQSRILRSVLGHLAFNMMLAVPGFVIVRLLMEKTNLSPFQPLLYGMGAISSYALLDLYLYLNKEA